MEKRGGADVRKVVVILNLTYHESHFITGRIIEVWHEGLMWVYPTGEVGIKLLVMKILRDL